MISWICIRLRLPSCCCWQFSFVRFFPNALGSLTCFLFQFAIYGIESKKNIMCFVYALQLTPIGLNNGCVHTPANGYCNVSVYICHTQTEITHSARFGLSSSERIHHTLTHISINISLSTAIRSCYWALFALIVECLEIQFIVCIDLLSLALQHFIIRYVAAKVLSFSFAFSPSLFSLSLVCPVMPNWNFE